jgi:hypothetical protein
MSDALAEFEEGTKEPPPGLFDRLRADPVRAPELIALTASEWHAPAADAWASKRRRVYGEDGRTLGRMAKARHAQLARLEGAATGVGGIVTVVPDLVGLAWIQSRLVFYVAAAFGFDPRDPMRPAELLVLMGIYDDVGAAREALDGAGRSVAETWIGSQFAREEALVKRLALMVSKSAAMKVGRFIPGFAIMFNSVSNRRDTNRLARAAIRFYGG